MSALLNVQAPINSVYDLDYIGGNFLPREGGALHHFIESYQNVSSLETLTGLIPDSFTNNNYGKYAAAMSEWRHSKESKPFWDMVKKAREGKAVERVAPRSSFEPIQEWEGYVLEVTESNFLARLLDLTSSKSIEHEEVCFSFDDVSSEDDLPLISVGSIFRWSVGYERRVSGSRHKISSVVFRRLPIWGVAEIEKAKAKAKSVAEQIRWE
jgi:hypothetical protein